MTDKPTLRELRLLERTFNKFLLEYGDTAHEYDVTLDGNYIKPLTYAVKKLIKYHGEK